MRDLNFATSPGDLNFAKSPGDLDWPAEIDDRLLHPAQADPPACPVAETFGPRIAGWIIQTAETRSAPPDYVVAPLLSVASAIIANAREVMPWDNWREPALLWTMAIGLPSSGKSPALSAVLAAVSRAEAPLRDRAATELAAYDARAAFATEAMAVWQERAKAAAKAGDDPPPMPPETDPGPKPVAPRLAVMDATAEFLPHVLAAPGARGLCLFRDELSSWLENLSRYSNGSDRGFYLESFGARSYMVDRLNRGSIFVPRLAIAICGGIQPGKVEQLIKRGADDGMAARFLPFWPAEVLPGRPQCAPDDALIDNVLARLVALEPFANPDGTTRPLVVGFEAEAQDRLDRFRLEIAALRKEAHGLMQSSLGKLPGVSLRLALVLAFLDHAAGDAPEPRDITDQTYARSVAFIRSYVIPMLRLTYATEAERPGDAAARRLVAIIREKAWTACSSRDVQRLGRAGLSTRDQVHAALTTLTAAGLAMQVDPVNTSGGGRPARRFLIHPAVHTGEVDP